jgi:RNA polymerase sigma factor (sigma-70 family)
MRLESPALEVPGLAALPEADRSQFGTDSPASQRHVRALRALYREHRTRLRRYFAYRVPTEADDLVQETFLRFLRVTLHDGQPVQKPHAYLNRVAQNLLHEQARCAARRSSALHVSIDDVDLAASDPVAQLEARDLLNRTESALAKMKPATRDIFVAHRIEGYTYAEIAARTGRSLKSVEKHIAKAIVILNRAMRRG